MFDTRKSNWFIYEFIFDRMRAIRQDMVIQSFNDETNRSFLEPIIMFMAYSMYR